MVIPRTI
jgi:hypothetical protein